MERLNFLNFHRIFEIRMKITLHMKKYSESTLQIFFSRINLLINFSFVHCILWLKIIIFSFKCLFFCSNVKYRSCENTFRIQISLKIMLLCYWFQNMLWKSTHMLLILYYIDLNHWSKWIRTNPKPSFQSESTRALIDPNRIFNQNQSE